MSFEWDAEKAQANETNHGVTFDEAQTIFDDPFIAIAQDPIHSSSEGRFLAVGESVRRRVLVVSFTERTDNIRVISARVATARERKMYEKGQ
jgi:uncharacterized DUF497 family protein